MLFQSTRPLVSGRDVAWLLYDHAVAMVSIHLDTECPTCHQYFNPLAGPTRSIETSNDWRSTLGSDISIHSIDRDAQFGTNFAAIKVSIHSIGIDRSRPLAIAQGLGRVAADFNPLDRSRSIETSAMGKCWKATPTFQSTRSIEIDRDLSVR